MLIGVKDSQSDLEKHYKTFCGLYFGVYFLGNDLETLFVCKMAFRGVLGCRRDNKKTALNP